MNDVMPAPQHAAPGGEIRWAVGLPAGPRSQSWRLFGSRKDDEVYLGPRWDGGVIKLSLHRSGRWRMAWTNEFAQRIGLPADADRVLSRWDPPDDLRPGWQHAATVLVTRESMAQFATPERRARRVAFFPEPAEDGGLWFVVMLGRAGAGELAVREAVEVGTLALPSGGIVGVMVRPDVLPDRTAAHVAGVRAHMLEVLIETRARGNRGFAWGRMDDGAVLLLDPGPVEPPGRSSGRGGPGRVFVHRIDRLRGEPSAPGDGPHVG